MEADVDGPMLMPSPAAAPPADMAPRRPVKEPAKKPVTASLRASVEAIAGPLAQATFEGVRRAHLATLSACLPGAGRTLGTLRFALTIDATGAVRDLRVRADGGSAAVGRGLKGRLERLTFPTQGGDTCITFTLTPPPAT